MKLHQWIGASLLAVTVASPMAAVADDLAPLDGVWAEDICKSSKINSYRKQEFWSFESSIVQAVNSMVYFDQEDRRCANPPVFYINTYFEYKADPLADDKFSSIDFSVEKIAFKTDDESLAKRLASEEACGLKNWVAGREIDISARDCSEQLKQKFREPLDKLYAVYKLDVDMNLVLTKKLKGSAEKRGKGKKQTFVKIQDM